MMTERARTGLGDPRPARSDPARAWSRALSRSGSNRPTPVRAPRRITSRRFRSNARNSAQPNAPRTGPGMLRTPKTQPYRKHPDRVWGDVNARYAIIQQLFNKG